MTTARVEIPPKLLPVFDGEARYRCAHGGRGSGKSYSFGLLSAVRGYAAPMRILATRELQVSIKESFYAEVRKAIEEHPWLEDHYEIGEHYIRGRNGTEYIFRGLRHNISSIKSMANIDLCIIEEAEDVPEQSWRSLTQTIRAPGSEIWVIWNPRKDGSPVDHRFIKNQPARCKIAQLNHQDNPWFPAELEEERKNDAALLDANTYAHIWDGVYLENSDAQVLAGKVRIAEFEPGEDWAGPYYGLDYGFAQDPTAGVEVWIDDNTLYVYRESGDSGVELDDTPEMLRADMPGIERHEVRADSARPESSSHLRRHGLPRVTSVQKWQGSVEDGIKHMRSYREIVIHERCRNTAREARLYSYKVDRHTGEIRPDVVDAHNHYMDAIRYALAPLIRQRARPRVRRL